MRNARAATGLPPGGRPRDEDRQTRKPLAFWDQIKFLILLGVVYGYVLEIDSRATPGSMFAGRLMAILYGVGAALTLDEFALWLNLANVYWSREGRESIDAVFLFGSLLAIGTWGAPLFAAILRKK